MRVTEVPRSPAQPSRLVVWLIQGTPHTAVRLWQLCHLVGDSVFWLRSSPCLGAITRKAVYFTKASVRP